MKIIEDEKEAELQRLKLEEGLKIDGLTDKGQFTSFEINWVDCLATYTEAKTKAIELFEQDYDDRLFFLGSSRDLIRGKPQLIHENMQRIPVVRKTTKIIRKKDSEDYLVRYFFLDDTFDKRYDGKIN